LHPFLDSHFGSVFVSFDSRNLLHALLGGGGVCVLFSYSCGVCGCVFLFFLLLLAVFLLVVIVYLVSFSYFVAVFFVADAYCLLLNKLLVFFGLLSAPNQFFLDLD